MEDHPIGRSNEVVEDSAVLNIKTGCEPRSETPEDVIGHGGETAVRLRQRGAENKETGWVLESETVLEEW